jgi:hypothetical protein
MGVIFNARPDLVPVMHVSDMRGGVKPLKRCGSYSLAGDSGPDDSRLGSA